jgi:hypothetical protein
MKKKLTRHIIYLLLAATAFTALVSAGPTPISPTIISDPIKTIACTFAAALIYIAAALAALVFVLAGANWIYSQDDAGKRKAARDTMVHCIIGLIIIVLANTVVKSLSSKFENCGTGAWISGW